MLCDNEVIVEEMTENTEEVKEGETVKSPEKKVCKEPLDLIRHISFVDCPGHDILMATMLTGAAVMDAAMLLIAVRICKFQILNF